MDNRVNLELGEQFVYCLKVTEIHLDKWNVFPSGNFLYAFEAGHIAV